VTTEPEPSATASGESRINNGVHDQKFSGGGQEPFVEERQDVSTRSYALAPHSCPMAYISLYRKYRSQSFDEVIGQSHITTVLRNAVCLGRIAHAYLFCGPRGCGKTTTARILARALNCFSSEGPTPEPCGTCEMCVRIWEGTAMDVIEMDAASETGIEDVREKIIENAKYAPVEARYKVYIIDEVHDLSQKAFDSLLKTIEEPPAHVVFILATTEAHKVPITIRSRCQRMDFRRGTLADLTANLQRVLEKEGIAYELEALSAIATAAEGSFRDSLSILEQVLAFSEGKLTAEVVHAAVGTVGMEMLDRMTQTIASDDLRAVFQLAGELVEAGKDVKQILVALQAHLRNLLVAGLAQGSETWVDISPERFLQLKEQARYFTTPQILQMLDIVAEAERDIRFTGQHRLLLERTLWSILPGNLQRETHLKMISAEMKTPRLVPSAQPIPVAQATTSPSVASMPATKSAGAFSLEAVRHAWPRVVQRLVQRYASARAVFTEDVYVKEINGNVVSIAFPDTFKQSRADRPDSREKVEKMLAAELGVEGIKIRAVLGEAPVTMPVAEEEPSHEPVNMAIESPPADFSRNGGSLSASSSEGEGSEPVLSEEGQSFLNEVIEAVDGKLMEE
jgi:DNA polymerase-3 subunit gamma/tau